MILAAGARLGPYEILGLVGAGGMGEVYRANDTSLDRDVAIKVLTAAAALDSDRVARFEREAKLLAALNNPHIAQIHGVDTSIGVPALVMEFVAGETLADRLSRGPLPIREALAIARQIAEAMEAAHERGIIHRDLKPANIKITTSGSAKVLDFGLAKIVRDEEAEPTADTLTTSGVQTRPGLIVGTVAYMSPEQARGEVLDRRTDIWAFGCVLYEMLTGQRAFAGRTATDTMAAVIGRDPDWSHLPRTTPGFIQQLLRRCLEKNPRQRLRDIGDARLEIEQHAMGRRRLPASYLPLSVAALVILIAASAALLLVGRDGPVTVPSEYTPLTNFARSAVAPTLSPDGRMVTFKVGEDFFLGEGEIYVKMLPDGEAVRLTGDTELPKYGPVFTRDGTRVVYTQLTSSDGNLSWDSWIVPVLGGTPAPLLPNASGLTWLDGRHAIFAEIKSGLHMGIVTATVTRAGRREIYFPSHPAAMAHYAHASPDRRFLLIVEMDQSHAFTMPCRLVPFDGSSSGRHVGPKGICSAAAWSPDGKWMYFGAYVDGSSHLWRQRFPDGTPEQITFGPTEQEGIAVAPDGRSLVTSLGTRQSAIWIRDGAAERPLTNDGYAWAPRLTRDGNRVFYLVRPQPGDDSGELRVMDVASGKAESILPGFAVEDYDISADETSVAFTVRQEGVPSVWIAPLNRRTAPREIAKAADQVSFGPAGDVIFRSLERTENVLVRARHDGTHRRRIPAPPLVDKGRVSPDGAWVIVHSSGIEPAPVTSTFAVPVEGGSPRIICYPLFCGVRWAPDGRFFYLPVNPNVATSFATATLALPTQDGSLPSLPASGVDLAQQALTLPGARLIEQGSMAPGPDPSRYAFTKAALHRNLYRIPLH